MMNPEQIKQEQERVGKLVRDYDRAYEVLMRHDALRTEHCEKLAAASDDWDLPETTREHEVAFRAYKSAERALCDQGVQVTRAYLALLDAHLALHAQLAQVGGREKVTPGMALDELAAKMGWNRMSLPDLELLQRHDTLPERRAQRGEYIRLRAGLAHADQQARLRALVVLLGQEIECTFKDAEHAARNLEPKPMKVLEGMWWTRRAYDAVKACADELEAALGGGESNG